MFVVSVKSNRLKAIAISMVIVAFCIAVVFSVVKGLRQNKVMLEDGDISYKASDESERSAFFSQFGWEIDEEPLGVKEIVIPENFDEEYEKYNVIQKKQELDLEKYKGEKAKRWTYNVKNYPGLSDVPGAVTGSIIVLNGAVIAGDVTSSAEGKKFVSTFDYPEEAVTENEKSDDV